MAQAPVPEWKIQEIEQWYADDEDLRSLGSVAHGLGLSRETVRKYRDIARERRIAERFKNSAALQQSCIDDLEELKHMAAAAARRCAEQNDTQGQLMFMKEVRHSVLATAKVAGVDGNVVQLSGPQVSSPSGTGAAELLRERIGLAKAGKPIPKSEPSEGRDIAELLAERMEEVSPGSTANTSFGMDVND